MKTEGNHIIGYKSKSPDTNIDGFRPINPATQKPVGEITYYSATEKEMDSAMELSSSAFETYKNMSAARRAEFLRAAADEIEAAGDALTQTGTAETGLPAGRLEGERERTTGQLRLFADYIEQGFYVQAIIDEALPDRTPPRSDLRRMNHPLGPVVVFGASNFPLAFSVAGGDTASALASGCPVVVKAHPAHPGTSEIAARAIMRAAQKTNMPEGVFSMVQGNTHESGAYLVSHPLTCAVGFTGSFAGGKALYDLAQKRPVPIPVYSEMGSSNPVFILPGALAQNKDDIAEKLTGSVNLGAGQFCTNPGLVMLPKGEETDKFAAQLTKNFEAQTGQTMLTEGIHQSYNEGKERLEKHGDYTLLARGNKGDHDLTGEPALFKTEYKKAKKDPDLTKEVFGPSSILITTEQEDEILEFARSLEGHLTVTIHAADEDTPLVHKLLPILQEKAGRIIFNGYPTGVEVCHAMVHGGPYPATTMPSTTSVGTSAIYRFLRPVCYQDIPDQFLPEALRADNPLGIWRLINGEWKK